MQNINWQGVYPAVLTQFNQDLSLDLDSTAQHMNSMLEAGVHGFIMLGTCGENNSLEPEEKLSVLSMAVEVAGGKVPVLSGVSELTTTRAKVFSKNAEKIGVDGLMALPAMAYSSDARETITHFTEIAHSTSLPIMIYNNPISYRVDVTVEHLEKLAEVENIVSVKESSADVRRITDIINKLGDRYILFGGVDDFALESIMLGATGWISGLVNAFPRENRIMWDLAMEGQWEKARDIYRWYMPSLHLDSEVKLVQYIKLAAQECGYGNELVRPPRLTLVGEEREKILSIIHTAIKNRPSVAS